jgi:hypothetical protein
MTYRGIVSNGVVLLEGEKPSEGTVVDVTPVSPSLTLTDYLLSHPAIGTWKDRTDLPEDSVEASTTLRQKLTRTNERPSADVPEGAAATECASSDPKAVLRIFEELSALPDEGPNDSFSAADIDALLYGGADAR